MALSLLIGCVQQSSEPVEPTSPVEEPTEEEQTCTEMWICQDENTKAYRKSDCTFEQVTDCPTGCENAECKEEVIEEPEEETELEEPEEETKESCTIGFKCLDENRRGYQSSNCMFSQVDQCKYGCKDGECIKTAPEEEEEEETFSLIGGKYKFDMPGWRYSDFSKNELFIGEFNEADVKVKLYASASAYNYFRVESTIAESLWIIEKGITDATRSDCVENIVGVNSYHYLISGQTLCIRTREKNIALLGGYWEGLPDEYTELIWKYYS